MLNSDLSKIRLAPDVWKVTIALSRGVPTYSGDNKYAYLYATKRIRTSQYCAV